jgi:hypothetical protein
MQRRTLPVNGRFLAAAAGRCAVIAGLAVGLVGCESSSPPPGPYDTVSSYLTQIAEGTYGGACGLLDSGARESLIKAMGGRITCARLFVRCLPSDALKINRDQSQLLYATILVSTHRKKANARVSGTAVARAIKHVTLAKERGAWKLTSYGVALQQCPRKGRRLHAALPSPRAAVG